MDYIVEKIKEKNITKLKAKYVKTNKNQQVKEFFDSCLFHAIDENESEKKYTIDLKKYKPKKLNYIGIISGK